jgi:hypothetical protein
VNLQTQDILIPAAEHIVLDESCQDKCYDKKGIEKMLITMKHFTAFGLLLIILVSGLAACSKTPSDEEMTQTIQAKFYAEPQLKTASIQVAMSNGEATLTGEVSDDAVRRKAIELAGVTPGIKKVNDSIKVRPVVTIPAGTEIQVRMIDSINSRSSRIGSLFHSSLHVPVTIENQVVIPKGTDVYIKLVNAKSAGSIKGSSELEVVLDHVVVQGKSIPLNSSSVRHKSASRGKQTAKRTVLGGGAGAIIGGIFGGGRGAAIGAGVGAGGTLAYQALTKGPEVRIPAQTNLEFTLAEPFQVPLQSTDVK